MASLHEIPKSEAIPSRRYLPDAKGCGAVVKRPQKRTQRHERKISPVLQRCVHKLPNADSLVREGLRLEKNVRTSCPRSRSCGLAALCLLRFFAAMPAFLFVALPAARLRMTGLALVVLLLASIAQTAGSTIERSFAPPIQAGVAFGVTNSVAPSEEVLVYAVEENVPPGWSVGRISAGGFVDAQRAKIKWGPFFDRQPRTLTYQLTAPLHARGEFVLEGNGSFNGDPGSIGGMVRVRVHPPDGFGGENEIISLLPPEYIPGGKLILTNQVRLAEETVVYSVEDLVPSGWSASVMNHGGQFDLVNRKLKWGPFSDRVPRDLICELHPPLGATNVAVFAGAGSFDGQAMLIAGNRKSRPVANTLLSEMPAQFQADELITVQLLVAPAPFGTVLAVQDQPPAGWPVSAISHGGQFDEQLRLVKWGPIFTNAPLTLSYQVTAPRVVSDQVAVFSGAGSFDGVEKPITGRRHITGMGSRVARLLPVEFLAGAAFSVTNQVSPDRTVTVYGVEDQAPPGWRVSGISHGGLFDPANRKVKWGPFLDGEARAVSYTVTPPPQEKGPVSFQGTGSFNGVGVSIAGRRETRAAAASNLYRVERSLAPAVRAGRSLQITNHVRLHHTVSVYAVEDQAPAGWSADQISHEGTFDPVENKVKWGPFLDGVERELVYRVSAPSTAAGGLVGFDGAGSFNGEFVPVTGPAALLAIANHAPVAREDVFQRAPGEPMRIPVVVLLANDSDPDGDPLEIEGIEAVSARGVAINLAENSISYPAAALEGEDTFEYSIVDGFGGQATGLVRIMVVAPGAGLNRLQIETLPTGTVRLRFAGIPGRIYRIEAAENPLGRWEILGTRRASIRGDFEFDDYEALNFSARFYRTMAVP
jgi:hypothetical protein